MSLFGRRKHVQDSLVSALIHLKEASLLKKMDLKDILQHTQVKINAKGEATISWNWKK